VVVQTKGQVPSECDTTAMNAAMLRVKLSETPCNGNSVKGIVVPVPIYALALRHDPLGPV